MHGNCNRKKIIRDKYRVEGLLGEGGFGNVYKVLDEHIQKNYAMKIQNVNKQSDGINEIEVLQKLEYPGLPELHDVFMEGEELYIVMELVQGVTLEEYIRVRGQLSVKETIWICRQLCAILSYLHSRALPVIHGDLKPQNIMVNQDKVSLIDFGCAYLQYSEQGIFYGTPEYAAPEVVKGELSTRSDVYSFGKVMLYMLTGRRGVLFDENSLKSGLKAYGVPGKLKRLLLKCLKEQPELRYPGGKELEAALAQTGSNARHLPGMVSTCIATVLRVLGAVFILYSLILVKETGDIGGGIIAELIHWGNTHWKAFFIKGCCFILAAIPIETIAEKAYKSAILECECSIIISQGL